MVKALSSSSHLVGSLAPDRIWSADVLAGGLDFVGSRFGVHTLLSHADPARVELPRRFPLIWVGSLFSHLPRRRFGAWLTRLLDALTDDGLLVFSTHGPGVVASVPKDPSGFTFVPQSESLTLDTEEYGATFVDPALLREIAARCGAPHLHGNHRDLWWIQDVWAASPRPRPGLERLSRAPVVRGRLDHLKIAPAASGAPGSPRPTQAWIGGWTLTAAHDAPVREVTVLLDGSTVASAELLPPGQGGDELLPGCVHAGWQLHGDVSALAAGSHVLAVTAVAGSGQRFCIDARHFEHVPGEALLWTEAAVR
jgi:hypothetical protein